MESLEWPIGYTVEVAITKDGNCSWNVLEKGSYNIFEGEVYTFNIPANNESTYCEREDQSFIDAREEIIEKYTNLLVENYGKELNKLSFLEILKEYLGKENFEEANYEIDEKDEFIESLKNDLEESIEKEIGWDYIPNELTDAFPQIKEEISNLLEKCEEDYKEWQDEERVSIMFDNYVSEIDWNFEFNDDDDEEEADEE
ncbi:hypothetical protein LGK97_08230 [Clostridium sp. CS001]|uniref:hypothetical protein n=1 Tax=Clostridium sp. CS001 TaxID=2880648 RepID=UPI001CF562F7|nr:hypothetical protein [Clostridium sp. CS001]MCB2289751.1 hypothetical protein [Clostridium sp. CS001]